MPNVAANRTNGPFERLELGLIGGCFEGVGGVMAMVIVMQTLNAEIVVFADGARDKLILGVD